MSPSLKCYVKLIFFNNPFALVLKFRNLLQLCSYSSNLPFCDYFGSLFSPKQASTAGRPAEDETLSVFPGPQPLVLLLKERDSGRGLPSGGVPSLSRDWLWCLRPTQRLLTMVMISLQWTRGIKIPWAGLCSPACLCAENHLPLLDFTGAVGVHAFPRLFLTIVQCGRHSYFPHFIDEKRRLRHIQATFSQSESQIYPEPRVLSSNCISSCISGGIWRWLFR